MCSSCSGDSSECDCQQPVPKRQKRGKRATEQPQPKSPETEPYYKAICRQLTQKKNINLAKPTKVSRLDELRESCQDNDEQLTQAQQDTNEMAALVWQSKEHVTAYKEERKEKDEHIKVFKLQLRAMQNPAVPLSANQEATAKVDHNNLTNIHQCYAVVMSTLQEKKGSLNNAYRLAGTASSTHLRLPGCSGAENSQ